MKFSLAKTAKLVKGLFWKENAWSRMCTISYLTPYARKKQGTWEHCSRKCYHLEGIVIFGIKKYKRNIGKVCITGGKCCNNGGKVWFCSWESLHFFQPCLTICHFCPYILIAIDPKNQGPQHYPTICFTFWETSCNVGIFVPNFSSLQVSCLSM